MRKNEDKKENSKDGEQYLYSLCRNKLDLDLMCFYDNQILLYPLMRTLNKKQMKYRAHTGIPLGEFVG